MKIEMTNPAELEIALATLLGKWPKTVRQAVDWLEKRGTGKEEANLIVETLLEAGLLDDALYARLFVEGHGDWGPLRLRQELKRRGVPCELVSDAIAGANDPRRIDLMIQDWRKAGIDDRKIAGRLIRRGFPQGEIARALRSSCPGGE